MRSYPSDSISAAHRATRASQAQSDPRGGDDLRLRLSFGVRARRTEVAGKEWTKK
jgi:hypothetical protein